MAIQVTNHKCPTCTGPLHYSTEVQTLVCDAYTAATSCPYCSNPTVIPGQLGGTLKSGILFLIAVDSRDYATITYGLGVTAFTDYRIEKIEDAVVPFLSDGDYQTAAETHIRMCVETLQFMDVQGEALDSHNDPETSWIASIVKLAIVLLVPAIIAGLVCFLFYRQMKTAVQKTQADDYIPVGGFVLTHKADNYTHTTEVRVYDPPKKAASSGSSKDSSGFDGSKGGKF